MNHGAVVCVSMLRCEVQSGDLGEGQVLAGVRCLPGVLCQDLPVPAPEDVDWCWIEVANQADECVFSPHNHIVCGVDHRTGRFFCGETGPLGKKLNVV